MMNLATNQDEACTICKGAVEIQHTPARDTVTGKICHDYCQRIETMEARRKRADLYTGRIAAMWTGNTGKGGAK